MSMAAKGSAEAAKQPEWQPRMWLGCHFTAWLHLLARGRFWVHWPYWHIIVSDTFVCFINTLLRLVQAMFYGGRLRRTRIEQPPIFILGHWRTGTTWLHELMILDERHGFPTTYQCMVPNHFVLTQSWLPQLVPFMMPRHRPMDNMRIGFQTPQEDEFALCMLGEGSPYLTIAFPNQPPKCQEYLDLEQVPPKKRQRWQKTLFRFLQQVTYVAKKRLVLKSPPHTARIRYLQEMFPEAVFIHIVRDPYVVYSSTVNLWKALYRTHGLQTPTFAGLEEYVFATGLHMYNKLEETRTLVPPGRFYELRYEDLVADPAGEMRKLYEHLQLGDFDKVLPHLQQHLAGLTDYKTNRYNITPELAAKITHRWGSIIDRYGYERRGEAKLASSA